MSSWQRVWIDMHLGVNVQRQSQTSNIESYDESSYSGAWTIVSAVCLKSLQKH